MFAAMAFAGTIHCTFRSLPFTPASPFTSSTFASASCGKWPRSLFSSLQLLQCRRQTDSRHVLLFEFVRQDLSSNIVQFVWNSCQLWYHLAVFVFYPLGTQFDILQKMTTVLAVVRLVLILRGFSTQKSLCTMGNTPPPF